MFGANRGQHPILLPAVLLILSGILGNLVGHGLALVVPHGAARDILTFGYRFGIDPPWVLNLSLITLTFGFNLKVTVLGVLLMIFFLFLYKKA